MIKKNIFRTLFITTFFLTSFLFKTSKSSAGLDDNKEARWSSYVSSLYNSLSGEKSGLEFDVFKKALVGYYNLKAQNKLSSKNLISIVDFSLPSNKKRLWIINLNTRKILYHSLVSHGKNSGMVYAKSFSNKPETHKSSIGFYVTGKTYYGKHALSLRLRGMDSLFNSNAFERSIVIHGAKYVSKDWIKENGMLGRSHGCPAIPIDICEEVVNLLANGTCLFIYSKDNIYEKYSSLLKTSSALKMFNELESNGLETYHLN